MCDNLAVKQWILSRSIQWHCDSATYFKLSYNHTQDAAVWSWLMVLRRYTMRYFLKWETLVQTDNEDAQEKD